MGFLQWNLGQGTLQPILREFFSTFPDLTLKFELTDLQNAVNNGNALEFAIKVMNGGSTQLIKPWRNRLTQLNNCDEFQKITDKYCYYYINTAINLCIGYNILTDRAYCLMFDIVVQCGSIPVIKLEEIQYIDKLYAIAEFTVSRGDSRWQTDIKDRNLAIVYGKDCGRGWDLNIVFDDCSAFEDELDYAVDKLCKINIITTPDYWKDNASEGGQIDGKYMNTVILKFVAMYKIVNTFEEAVDVLSQMGILKSPDYWKENAVDGKIVYGEYAKELIIRLTQKI